MLNATTTLGWNEGTLDHQQTEYTLELGNDGASDELIDLTRHEYITLKRHLAVIRGVPAPPFDEDDNEAEN